MQSLKKKIWPSTGKLMGLSRLLALKKRLKSGSPSFAIYRHIDQITLDKFLICLCEGDQQVLIISGHPSKEELKAAWDVLYNEYCEHSGGSDYRYMLGLVKEITLISHRKTRIDLIVQVLSRFYSEELIAELRYMGYAFKFPKEDRKQFITDLNSVVKRSKTLSILLENKRRELEAYEKKGGKKPTRDYFDELIIELSKWMGFQIKESEIAVKRFVTILRRFNEQQKQMAIQMQKSWQKA